MPLMAFDFSHEPFSLNTPSTSELFLLGRGFSIFFILGANILYRVINDTEYMVIPGNNGICYCRERTIGDNDWIISVFYEKNSLSEYINGRLKQR